MSRCMNVFLDSDMQYQYVCGKPAGHDGDHFDPERDFAWPQTDDLEAVFTRALEHCRRIRQARSGKRHDVWKRSGVRGQAFHVYAKAERLFIESQHRGLILEDLDDAYDIINYVLFLIKLVEDENMDGQWPWKPHNDDH